MRIPWLFALLFINTNALLHPLSSAGLKTGNERKPSVIRHNMTFHMLDTSPFFIDYGLKDKVKGFIRLIRPTNINPTILLGFTGGWIMNPSIKGLFKTPTFTVSILTTLLILTSSMVVNDIFDMDIDRVNNPSRPLITGEVTRKEAILFTTASLMVCEFLSIKYLPTYLQWAIHLSIIDILMYTPFLKPMFLIKNISCATLVAFSLCFSGLAAVKHFDESRLELLRIASRLVFFGSLNNEILLDICDMRGDRENNIETLPNVTGIPNTWNIVYVLTNFNILWAWFSLMRLYNYGIGSIILFTTSPLIHNIMRIKHNNYSELLTRLAVKNSTLPLGLTLIYLCVLAKYK